MAAPLLVADIAMVQPTPDPAAVHASDTVVLHRRPTGGGSGLKRHAPHRLVTRPSCVIGRTGVSQSATPRAMGQTYDSRLRKARNYPISDAYVRVAAACFGTRRRLARCPYCDATMGLVGTVEQTGRRTSHAVPVTVQGHALSTSVYDGSQLRIMTCTAFHRDIDPRAHHSPLAFVVDTASPDQQQRLLPPPTDDW